MPCHAPAASRSVRYARSGRRASHGAAEAWAAWAAPCRAARGAASTACRPTHRCRGASRRGADWYPVVPAVHRCTDAPMRTCPASAQWAGLRVRPGYRIRSRRFRDRIRRGAGRRLRRGYGSGPRARLRPRAGGRRRRRSRGHRVGGRRRWYGVPGHRVGGRCGRCGVGQRLGHDWLPGVRSCRAPTAAGRRSAAGASGPPCLRLPTPARSTHRRGCVVGRGGAESRSRRTRRRDASARAREGIGAEQGRWRSRRAPRRAP